MSTTKYGTLRSNTSANSGMNGFQLGDAFCECSSKAHCEDVSDKITKPITGFVYSETLHDASGNPIPDNTVVFDTPIEVADFESKLEEAFYCAVRGTEFCVKISASDGVIKHQGQSEVIWTTEDGVVNNTRLCTLLDVCLWQFTTVAGVTPDWVIDGVTAPLATDFVYDPADDAANQAIATGSVKSVAALFSAYSNVIVAIEVNDDVQGYDIYVQAPGDVTFTVGGKNPIKCDSGCIYVADQV